MASDWIRRDSGRRIVILDTSAVLMLFEFSIDLEKELTRLIGSYSIIIPQAVLNELTVLSKNADGKKQRMAKASLMLIKKYETAEIGEGKTVDDVIVSAAEKRNAYVVTNDKELRNRLKKRFLHRIFLRGKNHLVLE
jgi:rRNA-processing protein FCF1